MEADPSLTRHTVRTSFSKIRGWDGTRFMVVLKASNVGKTATKKIYTDGLGMKPEHGEKSL